MDQVPRGRQVTVGAEMSEYHEPSGYLGAEMVEFRESLGNLDSQLTWVPPVTWAPECLDIVSSKDEMMDQLVPVGNDLSKPLANLTSMNFIVSIAVFTEGKWLQQHLHRHVLPRV